MIQDMTNIYEKEIDFEIRMNYENILYDVSNYNNINTEG